MDEDDVFGEGMNTQPSGYGQQATQLAYDPADSSDPIDSSDAAGDSSEGAAQYSGAAIMGEDNTQWDSTQAVKQEVRICFFASSGRLTDNKNEKNSIVFVRSVDHTYLPSFFE